MSITSLSLLFFFFFNDTATTEIYTLSLHDALPIWAPEMRRHGHDADTAELEEGERVRVVAGVKIEPRLLGDRSEEHTSELQSQSNLVCRLLLEKKKHPTTLPIEPDARLTCKSTLRL